MTEEYKYSLNDLDILKAIYVRNNPNNFIDDYDSALINPLDESRYHTGMFLSWLSDKEESKSFKQLLMLLEQI